MAKVDVTDTSFYMNPAAYSQIKEEKKTKDLRRDRTFSRILEDIKGKTADELGPLRDLPVSEDSVNFLMDEVRSAGDTLKSRPLPGEIMIYKQAVRNFINYVVKNCYSLAYEEGLPKKFLPGYAGKRGAPDAEQRKGYTKILLIDRKLEDLAAMLLSNQIKQMELASRLEEIRGLLVDLLQ